MAYQAAEISELVQTPPLEKYGDTVRGHLLQLAHVVCAIEREEGPQGYSLQPSRIMWASRESGPLSEVVEMDARLRGVWGENFTVDSCTFTLYDRDFQFTLPVHRADGFNLNEDALALHVLGQFRDAYEEHSHALCRLARYRLVMERRNYLFPRRRENGLARAKY